MNVKAGALLKRNIGTLLKARGHTRHDLAVWCRRTDSWISKLLSDKANARGEHGIPIRYLDRIADFFGLSVYQLFQPGISPLTERRTETDRRTGPDRRISAKHREAATPIRQIDITPQEEAWLAELRALRYEDVVRLMDWIATRKGSTT